MTTEAKEHATARENAVEEHAARVKRTPRSAEQWASVFPRYPIDADGYAHGYASDEPEAIKAALETFGVVVVRVFSREACAKTVRAMFDEINAWPTERKGKSKRARVPVTLPPGSSRASTRALVQPDAPETWIKRNWPSRSKFLVRQPAFHTQAFANRTDEALYRVFADLWGEPHLRVTIDNWGVVRGTRGLVMRREDGSSERVDQPQWDAVIGPHWDYNPWLWTQERGDAREPGYQGLLALRDQPLGSGCHRTLPGGAPFLSQWCREREQPEELGLARRSLRPMEDDPILDWMQEIPLRAGHIVIWSWGQLHASSPNHSAHMRLHQYIRMFPAAERDPFYETHDRYAAGRVLAQFPEVAAWLDEVTTEPRARCLLGLERWP